MSKLTKSLEVALAVENIQRAQHKLLHLLPTLEAVLFVALSKQLAKHPEFVFQQVVKTQSQVEFIFRKTKSKIAVDGLGVPRERSFKHQYIAFFFNVEERDPTSGLAEKLTKKIVTKTWTTEEKEDILTSRKEVTQWRKTC